MLDKIQNRAFNVRDDEPDYAFVPNVESPQNNRYGKSIFTVTQDSELVGKSLNINGDSRLFSAITS